MLRNLDIVISVMAAMATIPTAVVTAAAMAGDAMVVVCSEADSLGIEMAAMVIGMVAMVAGTVAMDTFQVATAV